MSKIPAKKAPQKKALPKTPAAGKAATIAKTPVRTPIKPVPKASAKFAVGLPSKPATQPAAKPVLKPAAKVAPKAAAKPAAKPAAKASAKPIPKPVAKPVLKTVLPPLKSSSPKVVAKPAPAPVAVTPAKPPRASGRGRASAVVQAVVPLPPPTSRFADRFAPPRPPTRVMNQVMTDAPRPVLKMDPKLANAWKSKAGKDLSEPELFAMPESEYMNDKQLEFFRVRLQTLKDDLLDNAGETTEHLREDTSIVPDPADRATIEEEHALELRTRDRERKLLKKISQSLGRIDAGDYGFCDETGEPIGLGRLIARPTATLSLEAQQRRELKQKMFGD